MDKEPVNEIDLLKDELFIRWAQSSDQELEEYWNRSLEQHPEKTAIITRAKSLIGSIQYKNSYAMNQEGYNKVLDRLVQMNHDVIVDRVEERRLKSRSVIWAAASVVIIVGMLAGIFGFLEKEEAKANEVVQYVTKVVPKGVKTTIVLPDGTQVKLNSLSTLKYPSVFSNDSREVFLSGQAFFNVTENKKAPFLVHTRNFTTRVLGTSFDVRSYTDEQAQHVAVVTGKVTVATANGLSETLTPDEMTIYKNDEMIRTSGFNHNVVLGWKDGLLQFNASGFHEVIGQLSLWYGVEFNVDENLKIEGKYTGSYRDESLENVLKGISFSSDFNFVINNKIVSITKPM